MKMYLAIEIETNDKDWERSVRILELLADEVYRHGDMRQHIQLRAKRVQCIRRNFTEEVTHLA
jgi:hypothetical protein